MATRGADALVQTLARAGVRRLFTLSGNHIMPVYDAVLDAGIELIHTRHEAAAVHMADACARLTGEPAVALVTGGPGHANAVAALYTALMAESPVVLLSGHAPLAQLGLGAFQEVRQAEVAEPLAKASWVAEGAATLAAETARAIRIAQAGRPGPVHLSLPTDALESVVDAAAAAEDGGFAAEPLRLAEGKAAAMLDRLRQAQRPLILVGPQGTTRRGRDGCSELESMTAIPVITTESPRGINDPALGAFAQVLAQADCVLLLAKRLDFTLRFGRPPAFAADCTFLQIDAEQFELERSDDSIGDRLGATAIADFDSALGDLLRASNHVRPIHRQWLDQVRAALAYRPSSWAKASAPAGRLHPAQVCRPLQALLDRHPESVLVSDGGEFGQWAQACLQAPNRVINGTAGAIGAGLPFALGARCAKPNAPIIALSGDGSIGFHIAELDTAIRHALPCVVVVGNDSRWNAEYQIQLNDYGPDRLIGCELRPLRYDRIAEAFGAHGEHVTDPAQIGAAVERAIASRRPALVDATIDGVAAPVVRRRGASA
ncbi:MAG TPA: thiamine pyrophosphate-binding protein [Burkholderiaceae bacterium]|nr:thiamine pyrophosphate-binding protein [Burkholderiaceae bacterium]